MPGTVAGEQAWNKIGSCIPRTMTIFTSETSEESKIPKLRIQVNGVNSSFNNVINKDKKIVIINHTKRIFISEIFQKRQLKVRNLSGRIIKEFNNLQSFVDLDDIGEGLFIGTISDKSGSYSFKLLID